MTDIACVAVVINGENCVQCPEIPAVVAVPAQVIYSPRIGWDASAFSARRINGDAFVEFTLPPSVGTVVGLANERKSSDPRTVPHSFYAYQTAGREVWVVAEHGVEKTIPVTRVQSTDTFRIERRNGQVSYWHNNVRVYVSDIPTRESLVVVACMFASGDGVN